jgi:DinB superfamily
VVTDALDALLGHWRRTVDLAAGAFVTLQDVHARRRPAPGKWSIKEIVGHLIDSASNNHRRFVEAQGRDDLVFPGYAQDAWVRLQRYQEVPLPELLALWVAFNRHLAHVVRTTPVEVLEQPRTRHNLDEVAWQPVSRNDPVTLAWFVRDYVGHLEHHLAQIRVLAADAGPPPQR